MTKSESKYFNTAWKMDKALIELLAEKDFSYITVKEICHRAQVNRSTFYLHYENLGALLDESGERMIAQAMECFHEKDFPQRLKSCSLEELNFITPRYLLPYLTYIRDNRKLFCTMVDQASTLGLQKSYQSMFRKIFDPILARFQVPQEMRKYTMAFYIHGIVAIIMEWLKNECLESAEDIAQIIMENIKSPGAS